VYRHIPWCFDADSYLAAPDPEYGDFNVIADTQRFTDPPG